MTAFVQSPNLPKGPVSLAAVSAEADWLARALDRLGTQCLFIPICHALPPPVQSHADMLLHHLGDRYFVTASREIRYRLTQLGASVEMIGQPLDNRYPKDIALNALRIGQFCFAKPQSLAPEIRDALLSNDVQIIEVAQGYARCSVCLVDEQSAITADPSMATALFNHGIEVLTIRPGNIVLPGYAYGFIGGCCGKIAPDQLAFAGDLNTHPDAECIREFLSARHVQPISLEKDRPLTDIGGILPLMVQNH